MMDETYWRNLMEELEFSPNMKTLNALICAHQERHRHYHTAEHISACLQHLDIIRDQLEDWKIMALAFWFHDAIYKPFSSKNERDSADWAIEFLKSNQASPKQIGLIEHLIMATCHNAAQIEGETALFVDIDLAIIGARPDVYDIYERNIRREYKWVPGFIFRKNRKALLQNFLDRPAIYASKYFRSKWEAQARANLGRAIAKF